jgi:hypothetical protein
MPSLNTKLASAPNTTSNYVLRATSSTTIGNSTIQDDGTNVAIGTTPGTYKLNVSGTGNFTGALSGTSATFSSRLNVNGATDNSLYALNVNGSRVNISQSSAANTALFITRNDTISTTTTTEIISQDIQARIRWYNTGNDRPLYFDTDTAGTTRMAILANGNVGIGTSSPTAKLEIQNAPASDWGISVFGNTTTGQSFGGIIRGGTNSSDVAFRVNNAANNATYFTVQGNGNVGIGTSSPNSLLNLKSSTTTELRLESVGGTYRSFIGLRTDGQKWDLGVNLNDANDALSFNYINSERFRITTDGAFKNRVGGAALRDPNGVSPEIAQALNVHCLVLSQKTSDFSQDGFGVFGIAVDRANTSAYAFAGWYSSVTGDKEFSFRGDGIGYSDGGWTTPAGDYAEYFESLDGTALLIGSTVVLENGKVRLANSEDINIIGVIRPKNVALFLGNNEAEKWNQKYLKDDYGAYIRNENDERVLNPDYDESKAYIPREERQEWNIVGLVGQVPINKGQPTNKNWVKMKNISDNVEQWLIK